MKPGRVFTFGLPAFAGNAAFDVRPFVGSTSLLELTWKIKSMNLKLVASGAAANRHISIVYTETANSNPVGFSYETSSAITAGQTKFLQVGPVSYLDATGLAVISQVDAAAGWGDGVLTTSKVVLRLSVINGDVADALTGFVVVEEFPT